MKHLLPILLLLAACEQGSRNVSPSDWDSVRAMRDEMCNTFDPQAVTRCDRITFVAFMSAACGKDYNLAAYEENGKWSRDTQPCYPADSKSECSLDGYLSVLLASVGNMPRLHRMRSTLESNNWLCGEGPESVIDISPLRNILEHMAGGGLVDDADASITGFRGHLLASYLWLKRKIYGSNNFAEKAVLDGLYLDVPSSPFFAALSGHPDVAVYNLMHFPAPYARFWGSAPDSVIYAASVAVLEGR